MTSTHGRPSSSGHSSTLPSTSTEGLMPGRRSTPVSVQSIAGVSQQRRHRSTGAMMILAASAPPPPSPRHTKASAVLRLLPSPSAAHARAVQSLAAARHPWRTIHKGCVAHGRDDDLGGLGELQP